MAPRATPSLTLLPILRFDSCFICSFGIFDRMETTSRSWGSSRQLRALMQSGGLSVRAHLFGHLHEQRGYWEKRTVLHTADQLVQDWVGGCEYEARSGEPWPTFAPPAVGYNCDFISCNAMKNHGGLDGRAACIAGPGRLVHARRDARRWTFSVALVP
jgi:hypothetical protein